MYSSDILWCIPSVCVWTLEISLYTWVSESWRNTRTIDLIYLQPQHMLYSWRVLENIHKEYCYIGEELNTETTSPTFRHSFVECKYPLCCREPQLYSIPLPTTTGGDFPCIPLREVNSVRTNYLTSFSLYLSIGVLLALIQLCLDHSNRNPWFCLLTVLRGSDPSLHCIGCFWSR